LKLKQADVLSRRAAARVYHVMHFASVVWYLVAFNCARGVQNRRGRQDQVKEQVNQHGANNAHNVWEAVEAADVQAVQALLVEEPERATTARPTDGFTLLHAAAAALAPDDATDHRLASIMAILMHPPYNVDVHAEDHNGHDALSVLEMHAHGHVHQAARRFVFLNLAALN
jgi:hypothetical protein